MRLRVPDWTGGLEQAVRTVVQRAIGRGNVSLTLRPTRTGEAGFAIDRIALERAVAAVREMKLRASAAGLTVAPLRACDLMAMYDVGEELDRLDARAAAARELLIAGSPLGCELDFLVQEFNPKANTLCAKSQPSALTRTGLDLKAMIEQMREQVQNLG